MSQYVFKEYGKDRFSIYEMANRNLINSPAKLSQFHLIMVSEGSIEIDVNFRVFNLTEKSSLHLSAGDMVRMLKTSDSIKGYHIVFTPEFQNEIRSSRNSPINLQLKKEYPHQTFTPEEYDFLLMSIDRLIRYIKDTSHCHQATVIKNEAFNLLLNISDKRRKEHGEKTYEVDRRKILQQRLKDLINGHSEMYHDVSWYAEKLGVSPDYLSRITKECNGKSVRLWINESLISKATVLLRQKDLSIKEISEMLNFTDQSSFGRFFRKNTGRSPKSFRKEEQ
mgnify:CR=1 FL=1